MRDAPRFRNRVRAGGSCGSGPGSAKPQQSAAAKRDSSPGSPLIALQAALRLERGAPQDAPSGVGVDLAAELAAAIDRGPAVSGCSPGSSGSPSPESPVRRAARAAGRPDANWLRGGDDMRHVLADLEAPQRDRVHHGRDMSLAGQLVHGRHEEAGDHAAVALVLAQRGLVLVLVRQLRYPLLPCARRTRRRTRATRLAEASGRGRRRSDGSANAPTTSMCAQRTRPHPEACTLRPSRRQLHDRLREREWAAPRHGVHQVSDFRFWEAVRGSEDPRRRGRP